MRPQLLFAHAPRPPHADASNVTLLVEGAENKDLRWSSLPVLLLVVGVQSARSATYERQGARLDQRLLATRHDIFIVSMKSVRH